MKQKLCSRIQYCDTNTAICANKKESKLLYYNTALSLALVSNDFLSLVSARILTHVEVCKSYDTLHKKVGTNIISHRAASPKTPLVVPICVVVSSEK